MTKEHLSLYRYMTDRKSTSSKNLKHIKFVCIQKVPHDDPKEGSTHGILCLSIRSKFQKGMGKEFESHYSSDANQQETTRPD